MKKGFKVFMGFSAFVLFAIISAPFITGLYIQSELPKFKSLLSAYPKAKIVEYHRHWFTSELGVAFHGHLIKEKIIHGPIIFNALKNKTTPLFALGLGNIHINTPELKADVQSILDFHQTLHTSSTLAHFSLPASPFHVKISHAVANLHSHLKTQKTTGTISINATASLDKHGFPLEAAFYKNLSSGQESLKLTASKATLSAWLAHKTKASQGVFLSSLEKMKYLHPSKDHKSYTVEINMLNGKVSS